MSTHQITCSSDRMRARSVMRSLSVLALLACVTTLAWAGSDERKGTGGALELRLPVGPRGSALGSPFVADASGVDALFWNPSGLATVEKTELAFNHTNYIADMNLKYGVMATRIQWGTLAIHRS